MDTAGVIQIIVLIILLILSAFFSSAETALTTVNQVRLRALAEEGDRRAATLQKILSQHSKMLSTILIGNNIVNISASALTTSFVISLIGNTYVGIATGLLTILVLLFGEIIPKTWATTNAEKVALTYSSVIYGLMFLLTPVIFIVDMLSTGFLRLLHINSRTKTAMTENELKTYVDVSHEDGVIETEEREMIYNVFDFSDAVAKDIMIPRIDVVSVCSTARYHEAFALLKSICTHVFRSMRMMRITLSVL